MTATLKWKESYLPEKETPFGVAILLEAWKMPFRFHFFSP
jgi:hypothetical protein